jgi:ribosome-associated protein
MDIRKLQHLIVDALEDVKAQDILTFDTTALTSLFDRVVIASGTSNRQTRALASNVREKVKEGGGHIGSVEGEETGEWVLVDCGDAIVHIMQPAIRQYYRLEEIWGGKPVDVKRQYQAFIDEGSPAGTKKPPKRKSLAKADAAPARKAASQGAKATAAKQPAGKKPAAKKAAAKKAASTTPAAKRAAPKRPAATPAGKTAAPARRGAASTTARPAKAAAGKSAAAPARKPAKTAKSPARGGASPRAAKRK